MAAKTETDGHGWVYGVCAIAAIGLGVSVAVYSADHGTNPVPAPSATTMRHTTQGPRTVYPDCRDTTERPCVQWAEDGSVLVTETGARIPAIVVTRHPGNPRTIEIR